MTPEAAREHDRDCREMQTLLVMGGVTFFITIVIVLSKFDMSSESVMNYAPIIWLIGVVALGAIINTVDYYKTKRREKRLLNMLQQSLLAEMALPQSFPCLLPGPHDECCGGRGIPIRPLPTYDEVCQVDETKSTLPDYSTALSMLQRESN
ncbi:unnamed protein product [Caenorhabditis bovis]|uniref:Uncharacterized protein n=1 Tax=Caenorhabditis bovis TaxID=2654633 RepID=A0A8S1EPN9_9PELO|nr:unnamed protein product [Caenorhabditis bovis]